MEEFQMWELDEGELGGILSSFSNVNNKSINLTWIFEKGGKHLSKNEHCVLSQERNHPPKS